MADLRISELVTLAGANLAAGDFIPLADVSASESKKITVTDLVGNAVTLIADATIPNAKILFNSASIPGSALQTGAVGATQLANDGVTAAKLADESTLDLVTTLPVSGAFVGQLALDTDDNKVYCWNGSQWISFKAAGSINQVIGSSSGVVNIVITQTGDSIDISTTLDNTNDASLFLAGPTSGPGAVSYRAIQGADLPTPTTTSKGGVVINGNGLALSGSTLTINNSVTPETTNYHLVRYNANGLVTDGRTIVAGDLPVATSGAQGAVRPGTGLSVDGVGTINHTNSIAGGSGTKLTFDNQGHITASASLEAADIPNLDASKITTGQFAAERLTNNSVTGAKLANSSVTQIGGSADTGGIVVFPAPQYTGQFFYDSLNGDLYLWDGNAWQPITITAGEIVFAGTYDASQNEVATVTTAGTAAGLTVGAALPAAAETNTRYYVIVSVAGTGTAPAPTVALAAPDMLLSDGTAWTLIDVSNTVAAQQANNISITAIAGITGSDVQAALEDLQSDKAETSGDTFTGDITLDASDLVFDTGSFNTTLTAATASAARTITFPNQTGTVIVSGNASIVNADISASASIAYSKLAALNSGEIIVGSAGNVPTATAVTGDVTITSGGVTAISAGAIVNADINASAAIADTKLATISTAGKVSGTAITSGNISTSGSFATTSTMAVGQSSAAANTDFDLAGTYAQTVVAVSALDIDCSTGNYFTKTINANSTFTVSNIPGSRAYSFTLELTHTSGTITWFSGVEWPGGVAPTLTTGKTHLFMFVTDDGGTRWRGAALVDYTT